MKFNRQKPLVLAIALAVAGLSAFPLHAAINHHTPDILRENTTTQLASYWSEVWDRLRRKEVPGGSRGNGPSKVCAVVPGILIDEDTEERTSLQIWGLNPVFVWQEQWTHLKVFRSRDHEVLLSQVLAPEARHLVYSDVENALPLEPGNSYYWQLSRDGSDGQTETFGETTFRTLAAERRLELETELAEINTSGQALLQRMKFFADRGLWADVVRELYAVEELPDDLADLKHEIAVHDFCAQPLVTSLVHGPSLRH